MGYTFKIMPENVLLMRHTEKYFFYHGPISAQKMPPRMDCAKTIRRTVTDSCRLAQPKRTLDVNNYWFAILLKNL